MEIVRLSTTPVASIRFDCRVDQIGPTLAKVLPEVLVSLRELPAGPPFTRYHGEDDGVMHLEAGLPVAEPVQDSGRIVPGELPGGEVARTVHVGPYEGLGGAHERLAAWVREQGREAAGPCWESYVTDPGTGLDPATWRTEIFCPLRTS